MCIPKKKKMKRNEMKKTGKRNHYAIVTFFPERMTDTTLFLFEDGRYFTDEDMEIVLEKREYLLLENMCRKITN